VTEPLTKCANCPHPFAEHSEIEGMENRGHCKVPSCDCGAFSEGEAPQVAEEEGGPRYVIIARATDWTGVQGCQLTASGEGRPPEVPEDVLHHLSENVKREYRRMFDEDPKHVGVTPLPFLSHFDELCRDGDPPAAAGVAIGPEASFEEAIEVIEHAVKMFSDLPEGVHLQQKDALAIALFEIDKEAAVRAVKGEIDTKDKLNELANALLGKGAFKLANQIWAGHFDPEEPEG